MRYAFTNNHVHACTSNTKILSRIRDTHSHTHLPNERHPGRARLLRHVVHPQGSLRVTNAPEVLSTRETEKTIAMTTSDESLFYDTTTDQSSKIAAHLL